MSRDIACAAPHTAMGSGASNTAGTLAF